MRTFSVFYNPSLTDETDQVRFVKEGIAWWALLAPLVWFLYHRLWWEAAVLFAVSLIIAMGAEQWAVSDTFLLVGNSLLQVLIACEANDLRALSLRRKGFHQIAVAHGMDEAEAEVRFFTSWDGTSKGGTPASSSVFDRAGDKDVAKPASGTPVWPKKVWPKKVSDKRVWPGPASPRPKARPDDVLGVFPTPPTKLG